jgi:hypothetical protein
VVGMFAIEVLKSVRLKCRLPRYRMQPWADDTYDTQRVGGYRLCVERTETVLDEHRASVI